MRSDEHNAGTAGARNAAPGAATGQVRGYGMGRGDGLTGHPPNPAGRVQQPYGQVPYAPQRQTGQAAPYRGQVPPGHAQPYAPDRYQAPVTSQPVQLRRKRRWPYVLGIAFALVCVAVAALLALTMCGDGMSRRQGDAGQLAGKSDAEIQAELDRVVEEGMFNISIASVVEFESGTSEGDLRIENVPGNRYLMQVALVRNDTGEQIYQTDIIEPNHHIQRDALDVDLPAGAYECTALFRALDPQTEEQVGSAAAVITLNVLS